ncbi:MAG: cardiolipin synthase [Acidobacteria bacterium]|nr:cardiolipin synthase [Acidobacteriota bacterium]
MTAHLVPTLVVVAHWLIVIGLSLRVIMRRPPVGAALGWLAVVFSIPFVGAAVYLLFGEKRLGPRREAAIARAVPSVEEWQAVLRQRHGCTAFPAGGVEWALDRHAERALGFPAVAGNVVELIADSLTVLDRVVADIEGATRTCHAVFYVWHDGGRMADVVEALACAAHRGVECRALADAEGSRAFLKGPLAGKLRDAGVQLEAALPTNLLRTAFVRADLRNHRKILVIDDRVAYTGSQNLVDPRFFKQESGVGEWVDAMVRIDGPAAAALDSVFRLDWAVEAGASFAPPPEAFHDSGVRTGSLVQIVPSGPDLHPEAIHQLLLTAMYSAQRELVLTTPYFVPDDAILTAMLSAAMRGVDVTLIVPAVSDSRIVRFAGAAHFDSLLAAGVRIALFSDGMLHTKSLCIDGETSIFGSVNLDMRSLWLNFEISLFVYDPTFTRHLRALQDSYLARSSPLTRGAWDRRPAWHRLAENGSRLLGPIL